jgi:hypothetical protein
MLIVTTEYLKTGPNMYALETGRESITIRIRAALSKSSSKSASAMGVLNDFDDADILAEVEKAASEVATAAKHKRSQQRTQPSTSAVVINTDDEADEGWNQPRLAATKKAVKKPLTTKASKKKTGSAAVTVVASPPAAGTEVYIIPSTIKKAAKYADLSGSDYVDEESNDEKVDIAEDDSDIFFHTSVSAGLKRPLKPNVAGNAISKKKSKLGNSLSPTVRTAKVAVKSGCWGSDEDEFETGSDREVVSKQVREPRIVRPVETKTTRAAHFTESKISSSQMKQPVSRKVREMDAAVFDVFDSDNASGGEGAWNYGAADSGSADETPPTEVQIHNKSGTLSVKLQNAFVSWLQEFRKRWPR